MELSHPLLWSRFHRSGRFARGWRGLEHLNHSGFFWTLHRLPEDVGFRGRYFRIGYNSEFGNRFSYHGCGYGFR